MGYFKYSKSQENPPLATIIANGVLPFTSKIFSKLLD
jgi:hypothetical protein